MPIAITKLGNSKWHKFVGFEEETGARRMLHKDRFDNLYFSQSSTWMVE
jgi:hypothetical protein